MCLMAVNNIDENYFLPCLVSQDLTGVREETGRRTRQQEGHMKEKNKRERMSVRLVVSIQSLVLGSTATILLSAWLTTNGVVILCSDS